LSLLQDGFHYSKAKLKAFPDPAEAFRCRGAPFTFDARAFIAAVRELRKSKVTSGMDPSQSIAFHNFDHATQDPVEGDIQVPSTTKVVILEGNYTLLNQKPWSEIPMLAHDRYVGSHPATRHALKWILIDGLFMFRARSLDPGLRADIWPLESR
jgi:pantothenate kinase